MTVKKDFLILAHPRSGTGYMAKLMRSYGYMVGHEQMAGHGISDWMFAVNSTDKPWGDESNLGFTFKHTIHVIRNPIAAINSIVFTENRRKKSLDYRKRYVLIPDHVNAVKQAVYSYIGWNKLITSCRPDCVMPLENADARLYEYLMNNDYPVTQQPYNAFPRRDTNARQHQSFTRDQIFAKLDKAMQKELEQFIEDYNKL